MFFARSKAKGYCNAACKGLYKIVSPVMGLFMHEGLDTRAGYLRSICSMRGYTRNIFVKVERSKILLREANIPKKIVFIFC